MTPIVILGKEIFQPASKAVLKQLKKWGAKVIPKKEVTPAVKAKAKTVTKKNLESDKHPEMIRKIPEGVGGKVRTLTKAERKGMPIETYTHGGPKGTASRPRPKPIPRPGSTNIGTKATAGKSEAVLERHQKMKPRGVIKKPTKKAKGGEITYKKKGGPIKGKPVNGIKGKKVAQADWMKGLSRKEIDQILGKPLRDASGVKHSQKKKKKKPTKVRKAKVGGKVITYRMTGGQVVDSGYD